MVKCPGCGVEYSLGRKIFHSCDKYQIEHGIIWCKDRIERPWNCNCLEENIKPNIERKELITSMEKLIHAVKS